MGLGVKAVKAIPVEPMRAGGVTDRTAKGRGRRET